MVEVIPFGPADYASIAAFLAAFPNDKRSMESWLARFYAWWEGNPSFEEGFHRGWMLRDAGRIVGFIGAVPIKIRVGGCEVTSIAGTTWRVLVEFRGMAMQLKSRKMATYPDAFHFAMTPAPQVAAILKLLRYRSLDTLQGGGEQSSIVLNMPGFLRGRFKSKFLCVVAPAVAPFARAAQAVVLRRLWGKVDTNVRELDRADASFDVLWERTSGLYENTSIRTSRMVNWYCFENMPEEKRLIGCYRGDTLVGFMILLIEQEPTLTVARCVDLWLDPTKDAISTTACLVACAANWARKRGLDRLLLPHFNRATGDRYKSLGIPRSVSWKRREFFAAPASMLEGMTPENTYFVGAQGDLGI